jgi:hypothetical protein
VVAAQTLDQHLLGLSWDKGLAFMRDGAPVRRCGLAMSARAMCREVPDRTRQRSKLRLVVIERLAGTSPWFLGTQAARAVLRFGSHTT